MVKVITREIANLFLAGKISGLSEYAVLTPEAAIVLAQHLGDLTLDGLRVLDTPAAVALSKYTGRLSLNGLTSLSADAAEALSDHYGGLIMSEVRTLSVRAAKALAFHRGELWLLGLEGLPLEVYDALAGRPGIRLPRGVPVPDDLPRLRSSAPSGNILTEKIAGRFLADDLCDALDDYATIEDAAAVILAKHKGILSLNGLTRLSARAAAALAKHEGDLSLDGLTELSPSALKSLQGNKEIHLPDILTSDKNPKRVDIVETEESESNVSDSENEEDEDILTLVLAKQFLAGEAADEIEGCTTIEDVAAAALAKHKGELSLNGLTELTTRAAKALAKHEGPLLLNGLTELSARAAAALAKHKGELSLDGLTELSKSAMKALKANKRIRLPAALMLDDEVVKKEGRENKKEETASAGEAVDAGKGRVLTLAVAKRYLADESSVKIGTYTTIEDTAAEALADYEGGLSLSGLTELSDAAAAALAKCNGEVSLGSAELTAQISKFKSNHDVSKIGNSALEKAVAKAGIPKDELAAKLGRLAGMVKSGHLKLAVEMIISSRDAWFFEALLAGSSIDENGGLVLGERLKEFGDDAQLVGHIAWGQAPADTELEVSLKDKNQPLHLKVAWTEENIEAQAEILTKHVCPHFSQLVFITERELKLDSLTELSVVAAEMLARHAGELSINGLTSLSDVVIAALAKYEGVLWLEGIEEISDGAAAALGRHRFGLCLDGLTTLSDAAAEALSQDSRPWLSLNRVEVLTERSARALARSPQVLWLDGVVEISEPIATALAAHEGLMVLGGVTDLSVEAAEAFSKHRGKLRLDGLGCLSSCAFEALRKNKENYLSRKVVLDCLLRAEEESSEVNDFAEEEDPSQSGVLTAAVALQFVNGEVSCLNSYSVLEDAAAVHLAGHRGYLGLNGLVGLSVEATKALALHTGRLALRGLKELSAPVAGHLAQHQGVIWLGGLTDISDDAAAALSSHKGVLWLNGINKLTDAAADALSQHEGVLRLSGLRELSDSAAVALARHKGKLWLNGLKTISPTAATALGAHEGELRLDGVEILSDAAAAALAKHKDTLRLTGLKTISAEALRMLADNLELSLSDHLRDGLEQVENSAPPTGRAPEKSTPRETNEAESVPEKGLEIADRRSSELVEPIKHANLSKLFDRAILGDCAAQFELGKCYEDGCDVISDAVEAAKWYRRSAEKGFAPAQTILGTKYARAQGVVKDDAEAIKWLQQAAAQAFGPAQLILGVKYALGDGVPQDTSNAAQWFRKAAEKGLDLASEALQVLQSNQPPPPPRESSVPEPITPKEGSRRQAIQIPKKGDSAQLGLSLLIPLPAKFA